MFLCYSIPDGTEDELISILILKGCSKKQRAELLEQIDFPTEINA